MNKIIFVIVIAVLIVSGCRSVPKRDLNTREGVIAAHFTVSVKDVSRLLAKGYSEEECVGILFISSSTHLNEKEVKEKLKEGQSLEEIASEAGITEEKYTETTRWILSQTAEYSEEKQLPEEE